MFTKIAAVIVYVLFSVSSGQPVPEPNTFASQSACMSAAATYSRLNTRNAQYRCQPMQDVVRNR